MRRPSLVPLHGIASRNDLPLPFSFVVLGAAAALVISFVVLFLAWRRPRFADARGVSLPRLTRLVAAAPVRVAARLAVLALYAWVGLAAALGEDRLTNPVFGFVYVWLWVGLVPLSLLAGPVWRATNPLRTLHAGLCRLAGVDPGHGLVRLPPGVGVWPAAGSLLAFAWLELVQPDNTTLSVLRLWAVGWLVVGVVGAVVFGSDWIGAADPFEAYAETVAQLSPLRWSPSGPEPGGELRLANTLAGVTAWSPPPGAAAVVAVLLGSTAFDSLGSSSGWISTVQDSSLPPVLWATAGLLAMVTVVGVTFAAAAGWMAHDGADRRRAPWAYPRLMAGSLVPIVVGYAIAHYATLLLVEGQRVIVNLSDPLGRGWDVLGTADWTLNTGVYTQPTAVAVVQLAAILVGHLLGIVVAHERSLTLLRPGALLAGQWPMLMIMVGYTCAGLLLLFAP